MSVNEATARIKINRLLEASGWRFFPDGIAPANVRLEAGVTLAEAQLDALGNDFEKTAKGYIDFLLLDPKGFPFIVLEAKAEDKDPLAGKEQARKYARSQTAASSSSPTAICTTSGISNAATLSSSPPSPIPLRSSAIRRSCPTRNA